jgi:2-polyprenyl-3-methyl-5-hydroxy-6-metoxy-1,4-benzoquinol methylase
MARPGAEPCVVCEAPLEAAAAIRLARYALVSCGRCASWNMTPRPSPTAQTAFHDSSTYNEHPYLAHRRTNVAAVDRRCAAVFRLIGATLDVRALAGERVLDVGCDTGQFIESAGRQFGIVPVGIDVARIAVEQAKAAGIEAYQTTLEEAPAQLRDLPAVTAIDVIEHVPEPQAFFRALHDRLRPGGVAYVETPNMDSTVYRIGRAIAGTTGRPAGTLERLFPQEHIQYFSREGLERIAAACGLVVRQHGSRLMPISEIAVGWTQRAAIGTLQRLDHLFGENILRWAILQRPGADRS